MARAAKKPAKPAKPAKRGRGRPPLPPERRKWKMLNVRITTEIAADLKTLAGDEDTSVIVRQALRDYIAAARAAGLLSAKPKE